MTVTRHDYPPAADPAESFERTETPARDIRPWLFAGAALVVLADHLTKRAVSHHLEPGYAHTVIPGVLRITHVLNTGAAFSVFADSTSPEVVRYGLIAFSLLAVAIVAGMMWRSGRALSLSAVALTLILGGAVGNLYDRVRFHHVIDFIEVHIVRYHWPDFNLADSCIVIGACLLILDILRPHPRHTPAGLPQVGPERTTESGSDQP